MSEKTPLALTAAERKALKARAHHLNPVVIVGEAGLSEPVLAEAERAIAIHELIKIRVLGDDRDTRIELMGRLCDALGCSSVQMIGKLLVVFRPKPVESSDRDAPHVPKKIAGSGGKAKAKPGKARAGSAGKAGSKAGAGAARSRSSEQPAGRTPARGPRTTPLRGSAAGPRKPAGTGARGAGLIRFDEEAGRDDGAARSSPPRRSRSTSTDGASAPRRSAAGAPAGKSFVQRKAASEQGRPTTRKPRASGGPSTGTRGAARKGNTAGTRTRAKKR